LNLFKHADIITNLGFVRPLDAALIKEIKPGAVIPYMCEAWEHRPGDVDLDACHYHGVPVLGTNESYPGLNVFAYCGPLLGKLLFEAGLEILGNRFLILSNDPFGPTLVDYLTQNGAVAFLATGPSEINRQLLEELDAVIIADFYSRIAIVGPNRWVDPNLIAYTSPNAFILQYAGLIDVESVIQAGLECIPDYEVGSFRMWRTLAYLSPRPVIDLHAAGLKVGELMWRELNKGVNFEKVINQLSIYNPLCQRINI
jgi:hypothetical protein